MEAFHSSPIDTDSYLVTDPAEFAEARQDTLHMVQPTLGKIYCDELQQRSDENISWHTVLSTLYAPAVGCDSHTSA